MKGKGDNNMDRLMELLKDYVAQNHSGCGGTQSIVDHIYWAFMENRRIDDKTSEYYAILRE